MIKYLNSYYLLPKQNIKLLHVCHKSFRVTFVFFALTICTPNWPWLGWSDATRYDVAVDVTARQTAALFSQTAEQRWEWRMNVKEQVKMQRAWAQLSVVGETQSLPKNFKRRRVFFFFFKYTLHVCAWCAVCQALDTDSPFCFWCAGCVECIQLVALNSFLLLLFLFFPLNRAPCATSKRSWILRQCIAWMSAMRRPHLAWAASGAPSRCMAQRGESYAPLWAMPAAAPNCQRTVKCKHCAMGHQLS